MEGGEVGKKQGLHLISIIYYKPSQVVRKGCKRNAHSPSAESLWSTCSQQNQAVHRYAALHRAYTIPMPAPHVPTTGRKMLGCPTEIAPGAEIQAIMGYLLDERRPGGLQPPLFLSSGQSHSRFSSCSWENAHVFGNEEERAKDIARMVTDRR